ncbi:MAG TPA: aspartyl protease family protein [Nevskia sp.]|nr:aspartyl protease family protein [Nevskia sp.]
MRTLRSCCLGIGVLAAGQAWAANCHLDRYGTLPVEMIGSRPTALIRINGSDTRLILDTGAFFSIMSNANATALKLEPRPVPLGLRVRGVGGAAYFEVARVKDFEILDATLHDVDFLVGGSDPGYGLLGANILDFADLELDLAHGKLTLFKTQHCGKARLAYWLKDEDDYNFADLDPSGDTSDQRTFVEATINGRKARALLDSGAPVTVLSRSAAERAGIDLKGPGVEAGHRAFGLGARSVGAWIARIDTFTVGTEVIQNSQMMVVDDTLGDADLILGVDFLLAHRMFIGNSVGKAYFTYNGGRIFSLADAPAGSGQPGLDTAADDKEVRTAADHALLGQAHLSRGETRAAIADLDEAVRMAPQQAAYHLALARAQVEAGQPDAALSSLDKSLGLEPKDADALLLRASLRLAGKDRAGAADDAAAASALLPAGSNQALAAASLHIQLGQPAAALPLLDDWIRLHEDDVMLGNTLNERCWARSLANQKLEDALKDCRKAIRRDGETPAFLDSLGMVELRLGHYPESIKAYRKAVAGLPRSAWTRYGLGLAELRGGQAEAGNADLAAARALDPQIDTRAGQYGLAAGP